MENAHIYYEIHFIIECSNKDSSSAHSRLLFPAVPVYVSCPAWASYPAASLCTPSASCWEGAEGRLSSSHSRRRGWCHMGRLSLLGSTLRVCRPSTGCRQLHGPPSASRLTGRHLQPSRSSRVAGTRPALYRSLDRKYFCIFLSTSVVPLVLLIFLLASAKETLHGW